jgi:hypothetical protein
MSDPGVKYTLDFQDVAKKLYSCYMIVKPGAPLQPGYYPGMHTLEVPPDSGKH